MILVAGNSPDRFRDSHDKRPTEIDLQQWQELLLVIVSTPVPIVTSLLPLIRSTLPEDRRRVRLLDTCNEEKTSPAQDHDHPVRPAPSQILVCETSNHRPENGTIHWADRPYTECQRAVFLGHNIV